VNEFLPEREHTYTWDGVDASGQKLASGIYFVQMRVGNEIAQSRKVLLIK
jgi:hypothetical protein